MLTVEQISEEVKKRGSDSPNGIQCIFIPVTEKLGLKIYHLRGERDVCYDRQCKCEEIGLAPNTGEKFELPEGVNIKPRRGYESRHYKYGYFTEIVETFSTEMPPREAPDDEWENWTKETRSKIKKLTDFLASAQHAITLQKLRDCGFAFFDTHTGNWGCKNGVFMPVDFGM